MIYFLTITSYVVSLVGISLTLTKLNDVTNASFTQEIEGKKKLFNPLILGFLFQSSFIFLMIHTMKAFR